MKISDMNHVEDIRKEEELGQVVGGTFGLLSWLFGGYGYQQPPIVNNIYINNTNTSSSSSGSSAGASSGSYGSPSGGYNSHPW
jgi:hypothetical protein